MREKGKRNCRAENKTRRAVLIKLRVIQNNLGVIQKNLQEILKKVGEFFSTLGVFFLDAPRFFEENSCKIWSFTENMINLLRKVSRIDFRFLSPM